MSNHAALFLSTTKEPTMSDETTPEKKSRAKTAPTEGNKIYVTTGKHTYPIDIQIYGEIICGQWTASDGLVEFVVPDHLVEGFEKHFHFVTGNIVAA